MTDPRPGSFSAGSFSAAARVSARQTSTPPARTNARVKAPALSALGAAASPVARATTRAANRGHEHPERNPASAFAVSSAPPRDDCPPCASVDTAATSSSMSASLSSVDAPRTDPRDARIDASGAGADGAGESVDDSPLPPPIGSRSRAPSAGDRCVAAASNRRRTPHSSRIAHPPSACAAAATARTTRRIARAPTPTPEPLEAPPLKEPPPPVQGSRDRKRCVHICRRSVGWSRAASSSRSSASTAATSAASRSVPPDDSTQSTQSAPVDRARLSPPSPRPRLSCTARIASIAEGSASAMSRGASIAANASSEDAAPAPSPSQALPIALSAGRNAAAAAATLRARSSLPSARRRRTGANVLEQSAGHANGRRHAGPPGATAQSESRRRALAATLAVPRRDPLRSPAPPRFAGERSGTRRSVVDDDDASPPVGPQNAAAGCSS